VTTEPSGADGAFIALYEREYAIAAHAAYTIVGSTSRAQDLAQDAMAAAYARWDHVQQLDRPGAWVRRVAINLAIKDRHKAGRQTLGVEEAEAPPAREVDHDARAVLADAIRRLPDQQRVAVVLHYFHDLPLVEVAESLGCAENTVKVHLHRARRTLATLVGEELRPS
jgi:RNA polymerase sigma-70 factor (ECF subfamily)